MSTPIQGMLLAGAMFLNVLQDHSTDVGDARDQHPSREAHEQFRRNLEARFVGKRLTHVLDYYQVPVTSIWLQHPSILDRVEIMVFPSDERYQRSIILEVLVPPGLPYFRPSMPEKVLTRERFGRSIVTRIIVADETPEQPKNYTPEKWQEKMLELSETRKHWQQEISDSHKTVQPDCQRESPMHISSTERCLSHNKSHGPLARFLRNR